MPNWLALVITFNFVTFAWVFFRAPSIVKALDMFGAVTNGGGWDRVSDTIGTNVFPPVLLVLFWLACLRRSSTYQIRRSTLACRGDLASDRTRLGRGHRDQPGKFRQVRLFRFLT
jgi:hypothetical protein